MRVEKDLTGSSTLAFFGRVFDRAIVRLIAPHSLQCNLRTITRPSADQPIARTKTQPKHASGDGPLPGGFLKLLLSLLPSDTHVVHVTFIIAANLSATHCVARSFFSNPSELKWKSARIRQAELVKSAGKPPEIGMILGRFSP
jgi:hypothetical protein